jgi:hypothetical protein
MITCPHKTPSEEICRSHRRELREDRDMRARYPRWVECASCGRVLGVKAKEEKTGGRETVRVSSPILGTKRGNKAPKSAPHIEKAGQGKGSPSEKIPIESRGELRVCPLDGVTNDPPANKLKSAANSTEPSNLDRRKSSGKEGRATGKAAPRSEPAREDRRRVNGGIPHCGNVTPSAAVTPEREPGACKPEAKRAGDCDLSSNQTKKMSPENVKKIKECIKRIGEKLHKSDDPQRCQVERTLAPVLSSKAPHSNRFMSFAGAPSSVRRVENPATDQPGHKTCHLHGNPVLAMIVQRRERA